MSSSGKYATARFRKTEPQPSHYKNALTAIARAVGSTVVALCIWSVSAGDIVAKFNAPAFATFTLGVLSQNQKENRLMQISFQDRWSAVSALGTEAAGKNNGHVPQESGVEKIPFSCELAFSRLVREGNFSTRCIAGIYSSKIVT